MRATLNIHLDDDSEIRSGVLSDDSESAWVSLIVDDLDVTFFGTVEQIREAGQLLVAGAIRLQLLASMAPIDA